MLNPSDSYTVIISLIGKSTIQGEEFNSVHDEMYLDVRCIDENNTDADNTYDFIENALTESSHNRVKRNTYVGAEAISDVTLVMVSDDPGILRQGTGATFEIVIVLAAVSTNMKIQIMTRNTDTELSNLAIWGVKVASIGSIGSTISTSSSSNNPDDFVPTLVKMTDNSLFVDIAVLDLGTISNSDLYQTSGPYDDSTIKIEFGITMINNANFQSETTNVLVGVEYNSAQYIWVASASFQYADTVASHFSQFVLTGPSSVPKYKGALYEVSAYVTEPFVTVEVEANTATTLHDKVSIENIRVERKGDLTNIFSLNEDTIPIYRKSVTDKTNFLAKFSFSSLLALNNTVNVEDVIGDPRYEYIISMTVFLYTISVGETVQLFISIQLSDETTWSSIIDLTAEAEVSLQMDPIEAELIPLSGTPPFYMTKYQTEVYGIKFSLGLNQNDISCSAIPNGEDIVTGIMYGESGKYVSRFPALSENMIYDAGSVSWTALINLTVNEQMHEFDNSEAFVVLLISINSRSAETAQTQIVVDCSGTTYTIPTYDLIGFNMTSPAITDVTGNTYIPQDDDLWYEGSVTSLASKINFKDTAYSDMVFETILNTSPNIFGVEICKVEILDVGMGAAAILFAESNLENNLIYGRSGDLEYNDLVSVNLGPMGGSILAESIPTDYDVEMRVYYDLPLGQVDPNPVVPGTYSIISGLKLGTEVLWIGSENITIVEGEPDSSDTSMPQADTYISADSKKQIGQPHLAIVNLKTNPGAVLRYQVKAQNQNNAWICGITIINAGKNVPCINKDYLGKEDDPRQKIKLILGETVPMEMVHLDLGIIRNFGVQTDYLFDERISDEDSIEIGVFVLAQDPEVSNIDVSFTVMFSASSNDYSYTTNFVVSKLFTPRVDADLTMTVPASIDVYDGVMGVINITLTVPVDYSRRVFLDVTSLATDFTEPCCILVISSGQNVPCAIQSSMGKAITGITEESKNITLDLGIITYYAMRPEVDTEYDISVSIGVRLTNGQTEGGVTISVMGETSTGFVAVNSVGVYTPPVLNSSDGYLLSPMETIIVTPGQRLLISGVFALIPVFMTQIYQIGVLTNATDGRAEATVHGINLNSTVGRNIGCFLDEDISNINLTQIHTAEAVPILHLSQTNALISEPFYITNTGMTYLRNDVADGDDGFVIEADVMIADHDSIPDGAVFYVYFTLMIGNDFAIVNTAKLTMSRTGTETASLISSIFLLDDTIDVYSPKSKIDFGITVQHNMSESQVEIYDAVIRVCLPQSINYVEETDASYTANLVASEFYSNISAALTKDVCLDFNIDYLLFTDILSLNISVYVDPYEILPWGIGTINGAAVLRILGRLGNPTIARDYLPDRRIVDFKYEAADIFENLNVDSFADCQFTASTAVDASSGPEMAASLTGEGWLPAVFPSTSTIQYIAVDFLQKTRVTRITFPSIVGWTGPSEFKLKISNDGIKFSPSCEMNILSSSENLPMECRFISRFVMIEVTTPADDSISHFGLKFKFYGGIFVDEEIANCPSPMTATAYVSSNVWSHALYDDVHNILYFCYYSYSKAYTKCWSSSDGNNFHAAHSSIKSIAGYDSVSNMVYGNVGDNNRLLASADGANWVVMSDIQTPETFEFLPKQIPASPKSSFTEVDLGGNWHVTFDGISKDGVLKIRTEA